MYIPEGDEPTPGGELTQPTRSWLSTENGQVTEVERWPVKPNKQMTPSAHTDLNLSKISTVEIRDGTTNQPLLRAHLR